MEYFIELERLEEERRVEEEKRLKKERLYNYFADNSKNEKAYMEKLKIGDHKKYEELISRSEIDKQEIEKRMYNEINNKAYLKWSNNNDISQTKEEFIIESSKFASEYEIDAYVYTIKRYEKLLKNKQKLEEYDKLFKTLSYKSLTKLQKYKNLNYRKGLLLLEYVEKYSIDEICDIINNFDKK